MKKWMQSKYRLLARTSLVLVYLVIVAGAVVRMTGSGMGCPDWPKCFGYLVPPTEEAALRWAPGRTFEKGQVIIRGEQLLLAQQDFTTGTEFHEENWSLYTRHDYAEFNAVHTWIEYLNRLLGALAGLAMFLLALASVAWWKEKRYRVVLAWVGVVAIGFQAWLGATVVYSVLEPVKITLHMFMALLIAGLLLWMVYDARKASGSGVHDPLLTRLWWALVPLSFLQILMGTQVRQFIDHQAETLGMDAKMLWLQDPDTLFYVHRSFSILLLLLHLWAAYRVFSQGLGFKKVYASLWVVLGIIASGTAMNYLGFPWGSQALHLVLASVLFGLQWYVLLEMQGARRTRISS
jgi:cytochrome c oxidase assembly protein subunit 15